TQRLEEGERAERQALVLRRQWVRDHPLVRGYAIDLGGTQCNLGQIQAKTAGPGAALESNAKAVLPWEAPCARRRHPLPPQQSLSTTNTVGVHGLGLPEGQQLPIAAE